MKVEDFNNIPIKRLGNATIYMRDVADVRLSGPPQTNAVLVGGKQAVMLVVMKSGEASTLDVVDGVKNAIPRIKKAVPEYVDIKILNDASIFVKDSIQDVLHEMLTAGALTGLVVLLFLGSWRATTIIATSIPLSILTSIILLNWMGESINVMTLGGLALAVGILVDDATVMIENIDTHMEMGKPLETAIIDAANQIVIPTFVSTLCIVIAWFPLFELTGVSGYLFMPMAEAVIFAMLASFTLSRTLVPTMAKFILTDHNAPHAHEKQGEPEMDWLAMQAQPFSGLDAEESADANMGGAHFTDTDTDTGTEFTFQPADLTAKILNFGSPSPIDVQINGMDMDANYDFARKLANKLKTVSGSSDVVIQQTMRTPTILTNQNQQGELISMRKITGNSRISLKQSNLDNQQQVLVRF